MVNRFEKSVENQSLVRVSIIGVPFGGLKEIKSKTQKIQHRNQQCVTTMQPQVLLIKTFSCHAY